MELKFEKYIRKPFAVDAIEVTRENIREVARWCGGKVERHRRRDYGYREGFDQYIKVEVRKPLSERQTRAYYGDWILAAEQGTSTSFKVYTQPAFSASFQKAVENMAKTVERMDQRAAAEEEEEEQEEQLDFPPGDGNRSVVFTNSVN
jgi:hypothetical protein